jgi:hypothetical protein
MAFLNLSFSFVDNTTGANYSLQQGVFRLVLNSVPVFMWNSTFPNEMEVNRIISQPFTA